MLLPHVAGAYATRRIHLCDTWQSYDIEYAVFEF